MSHENPGATVSELYPASRSHTIVTWRDLTWRDVTWYEVAHTHIVMSRYLMRAGLQAVTRVLSQEIVMGCCSSTISSDYETDLEKVCAILAADGLTVRRKVWVRDINMLISIIWRLCVILKGPLAHFFNKHFLQFWKQLVTMSEEHSSRSSRLMKCVRQQKYERRAVMWADQISTWDHVTWGEWQKCEPAPYNSMLNRLSHPNCTRDITWAHVTWR
jgi:hypothetical protein